MLDIKNYEPEYSCEDVIALVKSVNEGEMIPRDGAADLFYRMVGYPGESFFLCSDNKVKFFYADNDDFIIEIKDKEPGLILETDANLVKIILLFKDNDSVIPVSFNFDVSRELYRDSLRLLSADEGFSLTMLSMLQGGLIIDSRHLYKIPDHIKRGLEGM